MDDKRVKAQDTPKEQIVQVVKIKENIQKWLQKEGDAKSVSATTF